MYIKELPLDRAYTSEELFFIGQTVEIDPYSIMRDFKAIQHLIKVFCKAYWEVNAIYDKNKLLEILTRLSVEQKQIIIPALVENSITLLDYIDFAQKLLFSITPEKRRQITITRTDFLNGNQTKISKSEFEYLVRHGMKCAQIDDQYFRPTKGTDSIHNAILDELIVFTK